jgi:vacuolar-type H+-ATPase subunit H
LAEPQTGSNPKPNVISSSLNEYHSKIENIIRSENERFRVLAEEQAKEIISKALQQAEETIKQSESQANEILQQSQQKAEEAISQSQQKSVGIIADSEKKAARIISESYKKAEEIVNDGKQQSIAAKDEIITPARKEAATILDNAKQEAQKIIRLAEEISKKEAKSRMKEQIEETITEAREQSDTIIAAARQEAQGIIANADKDKEKKINEAMESTKRETNLLGIALIEQYKTQAKMDSEKIRVEAEKNANHLMDQFLNVSKEMNTSILKSMSNAENSMSKLKDEISQEISELAKNMAEAEKKFQEIAAGHIKAHEKEEDDTQNTESENTSDYIFVELKDKKNKAKTGENGHYSGEIELKTMADFDGTRIKNLKKYFNQISKIKYLGEKSSEEGTQISYNFKEPLPLLDVLKNAPNVEQVVEEEENLKLIFR